MPANTKKYFVWRQKLKERLVETKQWPEFHQLQRRIYRKIMREGCSCNKIAQRRSWEIAAESFPVLDKDRFDHWWSTLRQNLRKGHKAQKRMAIERQLPDNTYEVKKVLRHVGPRVRHIARLEQLDATAKRRAEMATKKQMMEAKELENKKMPDVTVEDDGVIDTLRDTQWVYRNMSRLIKRDKFGLECLDEDVLAEAPSNSAIGLANYALVERKAFFEKFVIKTLPRETVQEAEGDKEEEAKAEHDPGLDGLERYIDKLDSDE